MTPVGRALLRAAGVLAAAVAGWVASAAPTLALAGAAVFLAVLVVVLAETAARGIPVRAPRVSCPVCRAKSRRVPIGLDGHSGMPTMRATFTPCGHTVFEDVRHTYR